VRLTNLGRFPPDPHCFLHPDQFSAAAPPPSAGGAFNGIEHGLVNFDRKGDGAGKRSGCKAWNSLGGISTALDTQGTPTTPPEDIAGRNCPGVVSEYNNGK
jgi:hypothetical protein